MAKPLLFGKRDTACRADNKGFILWIIFIYLLELTFGWFLVSNRHVEEVALEKAFVMAWNSVLENRESFLRKWEEMARGENLLLAYRVQDFTQIVKRAEPLEKMELGLMLRVLGHIKIFEEGTLMVVFLDGTEIKKK